MNEGQADQGQPDQGQPDQGQASAGERFKLEDIASAAGDSALFPPEVIRLWHEGRGAAARAALLRAAKTERNGERAEAQRRQADDLRLWLEPLIKAPAMTTINGIGTRLYGKHQAEPDGTFIATLWFVLVFIPIWPLGSYLVSKAGPASWHFYARAPRPPAAQLTMRVVSALLLVAVAAGAWFWAWAKTHTEVFAYNGFDRGVTVRCGDETRDLAPHGHAKISGVPAAPTTWSATFEGQDAAFETLEVDLGPHEGDLVVYNVGRRGVMGITYVLYGEGKPKEGRYLESGPAIFVPEDIDYVFREPPAEKEVEEGKTLQNSVLLAAESALDPVSVVNWLLDEGWSEQARALALAELTLHPENATLAWLTAKRAISDQEERRALLRDCIARAPEVVDLHRVYQDLWPANDRQEVIDEYRSRLAKAPAVAVNHYLMGRLMEDGRELPYYEEALRLDPELEAVYRALGFRATQRGDFREALRHYERFAGFGPEQAVEVREDQLRLLRALGVAPAELAAFLAKAAASSEKDLRVVTLANHLRLEADPGQLAASIEEIERLAKTWFGIEPGSVDLSGLRANLALTAGDLERARVELGKGAEAGSRAYAAELRLALSEGATDEDRQRLAGSGDEWSPVLLEPQQLLALELLDPAERKQRLDGFEDTELAGVGRLLEDPAALRTVETVDAALAPLKLSGRCLAYQAAARRLGGDRDAKAVAARRLYQRRARQHSVPGELPFARL